MSPDARLRYEHASYNKARSYIRYALHRQEGIVLVTGKPGTGKTTLIEDLSLELSDSRVIITRISCNQLDADDLLRHYVDQLDLDVPDKEKSSLLGAIEASLVNCRKRGEWPVLILDEAQSLTVEALDLVRMLTNFQRDGTPLLQVFLLGQEELRHKVQLPELEQLHQRIVAASRIESLTEEESQQYWKHRLGASGWDSNPVMSDDIYPLLFAASSGIPRWINLIGSRYLLHGMVEQSHELGFEALSTVLRELFAEELLPLEVRIRAHVLLDRKTFVEL